MHAQGSDPRPAPVPHTTSTYVSPNSNSEPVIPKGGKRKLTFPEWPVPLSDPTQILHSPLRSQGNIESQEAMHQLPQRENSTRPIFKPWLPGGEDPFLKHPDPETDHWNKVQKMVETYDDAMCNTWKGAIDSLLIMAGLFSATITAFAAETFLWLGEPYEGGDTAKGQSVTPHSDRSLRSSTIRVNLWFFLSLSLSLSTVLLGMLCLQWIREYQHTSEISSKESLALRQIKHRGLVAWKVPHIISCLPVALHVALLSFFGGLLELLWARNRMIAIISLCPIGIVFVILIITTIIPGVQQSLHFLRTSPASIGESSADGTALSSTTTQQVLFPQCPYKSPQARIFQLFCRIVLSGVQALWGKVTIRHRLRPRVEFDAIARSWGAFDDKWRQRGSTKNQQADQDLAQCFRWMRVHLCQGARGMIPIHKCFGDLDLQTQKAIVLDPSDPKKHQENLFSLTEGKVPQDYANRSEDFEHHGQSEIAHLRFLLLHEMGGLPDQSLTLPILLQHCFKIMHCFPQQAGKLLFKESRVGAGVKSIVDMISEVGDVEQKYNFIGQLLLYAANWVECPDEPLEQNLNQMKQMSEILLQLIDLIDDYLPDDMWLLWPLLSSVQRKLRYTPLPSDLLGSYAKIIDEWVEKVDLDPPKDPPPKSGRCILSQPSLEAAILGCAYAFCAGPDVLVEGTTGPEARHTFLKELEEKWKHVLRCDLGQLPPIKKCWFVGNLPVECHLVFESEFVAPATKYRQRIAKRKITIEDPDFRPLTHGLEQTKTQREQLEDVGNPIDQTPRVWGVPAVASRVAARLRWRRQCAEPLDSIDEEARGGGHGDDVRNLGRLNLALSPSTS